MADPSKTEKATPRRRREMRDKGQVAKSMELNSALSFTLAMTFLYFYVSQIGQYVSSTTLQYWNTLPRNLDADGFLLLFNQLIWGALTTLGPFFALLVIVGLGANVAQIGLNISWHPLKPDLNKINPINGFKRLFSLQPMVQLAQNLVKITLFVIVSYWILNDHYVELLQTVQLNLDETGRLLGSVLWEIAWKLGLIMLVLAVVDVAWQRWYFERNIRMSKQEIKDETKNTEGDPLIKNRIRQMQRKAALNRMMEAIPRADVILTNPTHLAVALAYERDTMNAPTVLAMGANAVAERIKERGREHEVMILENKPLARALFRNGEIGQEIPADLYSAVSEVLIYVYQLNGKLEQYLD